MLEDKVNVIERSSDCQPAFAVLASPGKMGAVVMSEMSGNGAFSVWYIGTEHGRLTAELASELPGEARIGATEVSLDALADLVEDDLLDLYRQVEGQVADRLAWDVSLAADLSPYAGTLQLNVARYLLMEHILGGGGRHVFLIEDESAGRALAQTAMANGYDVQWRGAPTRPGGLVDAVRARASALRTLWRHKRAALTFRRRSPVRWATLRDCDVLVLDWTNSTTFPVSVPVERIGVLERMPQILRGAGLNVGYIANPLYWIDGFAGIVKNSAEAHDPVVVLDECLSLLAALRGAWKTWRMCATLDPSVLCAGRDISALVAHENSQDVGRPQPTRAYAYVEIAKTLVKHGVQPKAIVYPFENQGWERALITGVRRYLPDCTLVAYQHCPFSTRMISFFPAKADLAGPIPDKLVVMGDYYADQFAQHGFPQERTVVGGSLRFERQLSHGRKNIERVRDAQRDKVVLCCTSIEYAESVDLIRKAAQAVQGLKGCRVTVNFHPRVDRHFIDMIRSVVDSMGEEERVVVSLSTQPANELFPKAEVVLYNNSGAVFDGLLAGLPAIHVAVEGQLNYDKLPAPLSQNVVTADELHAALNEILNTPQTGDVGVLVDSCIAPVDEDAIVRAVKGI